jgi:putative SOS response-associated peptidase YedK
MCGRYAVNANLDKIMERFGVTTTPQGVALEPRFNVAPGQANPVIVAGEADRTLTLMQWGLVPGWAKEPKSDYSTINARVETVAEKPTYRTPLRRQRCLVPATGYYEWQAQAGAGRGAAKQPFFVGLADGDADGTDDLFAFAGLYDIWKGPDGQELYSYAILTTAATPQLAPVHARMPIILPRAAEDRWLDPELSDPTKLLARLQPPPAERVRLYPVSTAVNNVAHDGPALIAPLSAA